MASRLPRPDPLAGLSITWKSLVEWGFITRNRRRLTVRTAGSRATLMPLAAKPNHRLVSRSRRSEINGNEKGLNAVYV
jgi:hypothetical protein